MTVYGMLKHLCSHAQTSLSSSSCCFCSPAPAARSQVMPAAAGTAPGNGIYALLFLCCAVERCCFHLNNVRSPFLPHGISTTSPSSLTAKKVLCEHFQLNCVSAGAWPACAPGCDCPKPSLPVLVLVLQTPPANRATPPDGLSSDLGSQVYCWHPPSPGGFRGG